MVLYKLFLHKDWNDICILDNNSKINKSSNNSEYGIYNIIDIY
jgi:hypothetical protein